MGEAKWLNQREQQAWLTFITASTLLNRVLDQQLRTDAGMLVDRAAPGHVSLVREL